jgi:hypothetical protein
MVKSRQKNGFGSQGSNFISEMFFVAIEPNKNM